MKNMMRRFSRGGIVLALVVLAGMSAETPRGWTQDYPRYQGPGKLVIEDLDTLRIPAAQYVGNQTCKSCHASAYKVWLGTKHARSFVFLGAAMGKVIAEKAGIGAVHPANSAQCLLCHTTAAAVPADFRGPDFRLEEGVKCEHCHGPGGQHVKEAFSLDRQAVLATRMKNPSRDDCLECHKDKPSHEVLNKKPFDYELARSRIAHPENREERLALLYRQPQAVLSISLRVLLSHFY